MSLDLSFNGLRVFSLVTSAGVDIAFVCSAPGTQLQVAVICLCRDVTDYRELSLRKMKAHLPQATLSVFLQIVAWFYERAVEERNSFPKE